MFLNQCTITKNTVVLTLLCFHRLKEVQDREQQCAAGLNTATATVYAIAFAAATFIFFAYKYHLQNRQARNRVKVSIENVCHYTLNQQLEYHNISYCLNSLIIIFTD